MIKKNDKVTKVLYTDKDERKKYKEKPLKRTKKPKLIIKGV